MRRISLYLLLCAVIVAQAAVIWRPFWGLEYEDAYVYAESARFMSGKYPWTVDPFKTKAIDVGSIDEPYQSVTYGGHSDGFPSVVAAVHWLTGYRPENALFVNAVVSVLVLLLFIVRSKGRGDETPTVLVACVGSAGLLMLYQTTGIAETLSSLAVGCFLVGLDRCFLGASRGSRLCGVAVVASFAFAVATKRENLVLCVAFPILLVVARSVCRRRTYWVTAVCCTMIAVAYAWFFGVARVESNEGQVIGTSTFALQNVYAIAPPLLAALVRPDYWGGAGILFLASPFLWRRVKSQAMYLLCAGLWAGYVLLYCTHYRSRYQVAGDPVEPWVMMRYSVNLLPFMIGAISSMSWRVDILNRRWMPLAAGLLACLFCVNALRTRSAWAQIEYENRIEPARVAVRSARVMEPIFTDTPMVARMFAANDSIIVQLGSLNDADDGAYAASFTSIVAILPLDETSDIVLPPPFRGGKREILAETQHHLIARIHRSP